MMRVATVLAAMLLTNSHQAHVRMVACKLVRLVVYCITIAIICLYPPSLTQTGPAVPATAAAPGQGGGGLPSARWRILKNIRVFKKYIFLHA